MSGQLEASAKDPFVAVVVLNWNGWSDTIECLESLLRIRYDAYSVIVVDNGSSDDSVKRIKEYAMGCPGADSRRADGPGDGGPSVGAECTSDAFAHERYLGGRLVVIESDANLGFAGGNNLGVRYAMRHWSPDYVLLLNNDTVVDKDFLKELVEGAENGRRPVVIGPKILYYDFAGRADIVSYAGGGVNWWVYPGYYHLHDRAKNEEISHLHGTMDCDWVTGAAMMVSKDLIGRDILNEDFFFGCEDVAFSLSQKRRGVRVAVCLDSVIWHKLGSSRKKKTRGRIGSIVKDAKPNLRLTRRSTRMWAIYLLVHAITLAIICSKIIFETAIRVKGPVPWSRNLLRLLR